MIPLRFSFRWCLKYLWSMSHHSSSMETYQFLMGDLPVTHGRLTWYQVKTPANVSLYPCRFQYWFLLSYLSYPNDNLSCSLTQIGEQSELNLHHVLRCYSSNLLHLHRLIVICRRYLMVPQCFIHPRFIYFTSSNYFEARYPWFQNYIYIS